MKLLSLFAFAVLLCFASDSDARHHGSGRLKGLLHRGNGIGHRRAASSCSACAAPEQVAAPAAKSAPKKKS